MKRKCIKLEGDLMKANQMALTIQDLENKLIMFNQEIDSLHKQLRNKKTENDRLEVKTASQEKELLLRAREVQLKET